MAEEERRRNQVIQIELYNKKRVIQGWIKSDWMELH